MESLDSRYTGAEDLAFTAQAAENKNAYYNTEFVQRSVDFPNNEESDARDPGVHQEEYGQ